MRLLLPTLAACVLASALCAGASPRTIKLFNGRNLDGWYTYTVQTRHENPGIFTVVDGMLKVSGGAGDVAQRWSTPITEHREVDGRTIGTAGAGRWHPPDGPAFDYLEIAVDELTFLEAAPAPTRSMSNRSGSANTDGSRFATRRLLE